ncbi:unnamed protein product [Arabis nemorensis]|uniref:IPO4/5-like TPR repeats domain-containing protein n=1 Tax=Arabis nemorensis TaxID=586526 RepID=A0A565CHB7_9BRAS|nr:unnamed protein product [Arabis nemorensis]
MEMIHEFLVAALSADALVRTGGEGSLRQFQEQDLPLFLLSLSSELANDDKPLESRGLADQGSIASNSWLIFLGGKVIAKVASIDIPLKQWPQLFKSLLSNMTDQASPATLKQSTLETLGYVCEEISHDDLEQDEANSVLLAIVYGTLQFETNTQVHLAAMKALLHALDIAHVTFDDETHRNYIMKMVLETAIMSHEAEIMHAACECLVSIVSMYYEVLDLHIGGICRHTSHAINGNQESVALQAVDFWSSICHVEIQEFENRHPHSDIIKRALPHLVPMLLETLLKQDQGRLSMAARTCLDLIKTTVGADMVPFVTTFVQAKKITEPHWTSREAATYALASILERFARL